MADKKKKKFTAKQQTFINEYLKDLNKTQAAIRSGYAAVSASNQEFITKEMEEEINARLKERFKECRVEEAEIIRELKTIALAPISKDIRVGDKIRSLELLGKHIGMFTDKVDISAEVKQDPWSEMSKDDLLRLAHIPDIEEK